MKLPIKENLFWEKLYQVVDSADPAKTMNAVRIEIPIIPALETEIRSGKHGENLKRVYILALNRAGEDVTPDEFSWARDDNI